MDLFGLFEDGTTTFNAGYFAISGLEASPTVNLDASLTSGLVTIDTGTLAVKQLRFIQPGGSIDSAGTPEIEHLPAIASITLGDLVAGTPVSPASI